MSVPRTSSQAMAAKISCAARERNGYRVGNRQIAALRHLDAHLEETPAADRRRTGRKPPEQRRDQALSGAFPRGSLRSAWQIIEQHGGRLEATREEGVGGSLHRPFATDAPVRCRRPRGEPPRGARSVAWVGVRPGAAAVGQLSPDSTRITRNRAARSTQAFRGRRGPTSETRE